jgi:hypothetical protein
MNVPEYMDYGAYHYCVLGYTVIPFCSWVGYWLLLDMNTSYLGLVVNYCQALLKT